MPSSPDANKNNTMLIYIYIFLYKYDVQIQKLAIGPRKLFLLQLFLFYQNVYVHSFLLLFGFLLDFCCC